jgi:hypothetical protein
LAVRRKKAQKQETPLTVDPSTQILEFVAGVLVLEPDADESDKLQVAKSVGLKAAQVARIFGKTPGAAQKALERTKLP